MKTLPFTRDESGNKVSVRCADGEVSVYSRCASCRHCEGVMVRKRMMPAPQKQKAESVKGGTSPDEDLYAAAMMFNTLVRDGDSIVCDDDEGEGFSTMYGY